MDIEISCLILSCVFFQLSSDDVSRADHYRAYLQHEISGDDPARVQCLYERAVAELCLDASLWLEYVGYLDSTIKIDTIVLPVCKRAVRNCPWSSLLWQHYLRVLERYERPFDEIKGIFYPFLSLLATSITAQLYLILIR